MSATQQLNGMTAIETPWPGLGGAAGVRSLSRGRTVALIIGLSALLWEMLWELAFSALHWLITL